MRKPHPPPVEIDNWPHPPIILEQPYPRPKRICGVFVVSWAPEEKRACWYGSYFSSTRAASQALGYNYDRLGRVLRKNRVTNLEGRAVLQGIVFRPTKALLEEWPTHFVPYLRNAFPWAKRWRPEIINLPDGGWRWGPVMPQEGHEPAPLRRNRNDTPAMKDNPRHNEENDQNQNRTGSAVADRNWAGWQLNA
jgi:hypothetical protein